MTDGEAPKGGTTVLDAGAAPAGGGDATPAPDAGTTTTTTDNGGAPAEGATPPADVADWRKSLAGDNADRLKALERFTDPGKFVDSFLEAQRTIRDSGRVKVPGANATAEEIAAWNKARGVPDAPDGYQITATVPDGVDVPEPTKQLLSSVTERLHKLGADAATVNFAHELVYEQLGAEIEARSAAAATAATNTQTALKQKWGGEFEANLRYANSALVQFAGKDAASALVGMELADGSLLGNNQQFIEALAQIGLQFREDPLFLESPETKGASIDEQIKTILKLRETADGMREYDKPETQQRLRKLYEQQARQKPRAA